MTDVLTPREQATGGRRTGRLIDNTGLTENVRSRVGPLMR